MWHARQGPLCFGPRNSFQCSQNVSLSLVLEIPMEIVKEDKGEMVTETEKWQAMSNIRKVMQHGGIANI